jgi:uncharacterized protein YdaU (DUF1376 family)
MPWFKFYPSDWLTGTRGLSVVETGVYITLMASMYEREAPIENDTQELSRLCGCTQKQLIPALEKLISKGKIILVDQELWNTRVEDELKDRVTKSVSAKTSAEERWKQINEQKQRMTDANAYDSHMRNGCEQVCETDAIKMSDTRKKKEIAAAAPTAASDPFEEADAALRKIPGVSKHPVATDPVIAPIWQLMQQGYDFKTVIAPSIRQQIAKTKRQIKGWGYFVPGIVESVKGVSVPPAVDEAKWTKNLEFAREKKTWGEIWGPPPGQPGCKVPPHLLQPGDGNGWELYRRVS